MVTRFTVEPVMTRSRRKKVDNCSIEEITANNCISESTESEKKRQNLGPQKTSKCRNTLEREVEKNRQTTNTSIQNKFPRDGENSDNKVESEKGRSKDVELLENTEEERRQKLSKRFGKVKTKISVPDQNLRSFKCDICQKCFKTDEKLVRHSARIHKTRPYRCSVCEKCFSNQSHLVVHERIHTKEMPFLCSTCGQGFTTRGSLSRHYRTHTGEKPYKCDTCDKCFAGIGDLTRHKRSHTGERPFHCSHCDAKFSERCNLKNHIRCHTGDRPYVCQYCKKGFKRSNHLAQHVRIHTGLKPYKCERCGRGFEQSISLRSHRARRTLCSPDELLKGRRKNRNKLQLNFSLADLAHAAEIEMEEMSHHADQERIQADDEMSRTLLNMAVQTDEKYFNSSETSDTVVPPSGNPGSGEATVTPGVTDPTLVDSVDTVALLPVDLQDCTEDCRVQVDSNFPNTQCTNVIHVPAENELGQSTIIVISEGDTTQATELCAHFPGKVTANRNNFIVSYGDSSPSQTSGHTIIYECESL